MEKEKRYYLRAAGKLYEVEQEVYLAYYKSDRHERYLVEKDKTYNVQFCDNKQLEHVAISEHLIDYQTTPEERLLQKKLYEQFNLALGMLPEAERRLIYAIYFESETENSLSKTLGISQSAVHYRRERILRKLKNMLNKM